MHKRIVETQASFAVPLLAADCVQRRVPLLGRSLRAGNVSSLIATVVDIVDMIRVRCTADLVVVASCSEAGVDVDSTVLGSQRFEVKPAETRKSLVFSRLDLCPVAAVELLDSKMLAQSFACCHTSSLRLDDDVRRKVRRHIVMCLSASFCLDLNYGVCAAQSDQIGASA
jgi:hypothetical protein